MNEDALVQIFDLYSAPLYRYALHLCGDPVIADHVVGDMFAKLLDQFSSGKGPESNLRAYLYQMVYHLVVDEARYFSHRVPLEMASSIVEDRHSRVLALEDQTLMETILHAIQDDLSEDQRHVIILRFWEEFSLNDTATILGKRVDHIKVIQARALAKLRNILQQEEIKKTSLLSRMQKSAHISASRSVPA